MADKKFSVNGCFRPIAGSRAAPKRSLKPMKAAIQVPAVGRLLSRQRDMNDIKHDRRIIDLNAVGAERAVCFQQNHPDIDKNDV